MYTHSQCMVEQTEVDTASLGPEQGPEPYSLGLLLTLLNQLLAAPELFARGTRKPLIRSVPCFH